MTIIATLLFVVLFVCWLVLPHTKALSEKSTEFTQIADEAKLAKAV
jgi:hypothetical protein